MSTHIPEGPERQVQAWQRAASADGGREIEAQGAEGLGAHEAQQEEDKGQDCTVLRMCVQMCTLVINCRS